MAPKKRERVGHIVRYTVDFSVPDGDPIRARRSCQYWLEREWVRPDDIPEAELQGWSLTRVTPILARPETRTVGADRQRTEDG